MLVANIKIWKSHFNIREGSDYSETRASNSSSITCLIKSLPTERGWTGGAGVRG